MHCNGCGSDDSIHVVTRSRRDEKGNYYLDRQGFHILFDECEQCANLKVGVEGWTDAAGNRISLSDEVTGKYSYAIDAPITSKRQLSDHLRRNNLIQKG